MKLTFKRERLPEQVARNIPEEVHEFLRQFTTQGFDIWLVGAGVRNLLSGKPVVDPDFTTNATPEEIQKLFAESFYDNIFGTVGIPIKGIKSMESTESKEQIFEVTTYRTEHGYTDKRRPDKVVWGRTLEEDLARRDFTINAMVIGLGKGRRAKGEEQKLLFVDPFGGRKDLDKKLVRAVGEASERFGEDALRMMRAIRIGAQLKFTIEDETLAAIQKHGELLGHVSKERVRDELLKIIASDHPAEGVLLLHYSGLLHYIIPEMLAMQGVKQIGHHIYDVWTHSIESLRGCPSTDPIIRLATLLHDIGKPKTAQPRDGKEVTFYGHEVVGARMVKEIAERLRFSRKEIDRLTTLVRWHMFAYDANMTDAAIRRFIRRVGVENINDMMMLRTGDRVGGGSKSTSWRLRELQRRVGEQLYEPLTVKDLKIDGHDVMKTLGLKPGPEVGNILKALFEEVIEDTRKNEREYLLKRISELHETSQ